MTYIDTIPQEQADGEVKRIYDECIAELGFLQNAVKMFCHRPNVLHAFENLLKSIVGSMDRRRYELVTLAAARALRSSYCMLAHSTAVLEKELYSVEQLTRIVNDYRDADLSAAEVAMMAFAEQIVKDATAIEMDDIAGLRAHGLTDAEIFDIAAAASVRSFASKLLDSLGARPDPQYRDLDAGLREVVVVGHPISSEGE